MAREKMEDLIDNNPQAKRDRDVIRQAMSELQLLRESGVSRRGYSLVPPFGEKRIMKRQDSKQRTKIEANRSERHSLDGVFLLNEDAYVRFEACMSEPGAPTPANRRGAEMLRKLYSRKS
jgi:hypothetical protein